MAEPGGVVHTLSTASDHRSVACRPRSEPELSPAPVDNGLSGTPPGHLDSPLGRSTGDEQGRYDGSRSGARPRRTTSYGAVGGRPLASLLSQPSTAWGVGASSAEELLREHHRAGVVGRPGRAGAPRQRRRLGRRPRGLRAGRAAEPPGRPHAAAGQRRRAERARLDAAVQGRHRRRHRGRSAAPTSTARSHEIDLRRDHRPLRPRRAGRPGHRRRRAAAPRRAGRGSAARRTSTRSRPTCRSPPTPATTPRSSARRRSCAGWSTPAPGSCRWATPARARSTTSSTGRRPRSTRSPTSAPSEDYAPLSDDHGRRPRRDRGDRQPRRPGCTACPTGFADLDDLTNGLHAGQMVIVAARPAMGKSTLGPRPLPGGVDPQQHDQRASSAWR